MDKLQLQRPYTFKKTSWIFPAYTLEFEGTPILEISGYHNTKRMMDLMNAAYMLGQGNGYIQGMEDFQEK